MYNFLAKKSGHSELNYKYKTTTKDICTVVGERVNKKTLSK